VFDDDDDDDDDEMDVDERWRFCGHALQDAFNNPSGRENIQINGYFE